MHTFRVGWEIDIEASSAEEAARKALKIQRDPESTATVFQVYAKDDAHVDWTELEELDGTGAQRSCLVSGGAQVDVDALDDPEGVRLG